ncbi:hypothetical protein [Bacillus carboniphilus]|uniref:hypothetical protein n=1 Tax=Bacillus carboniphilus TaxID=86663 RepID=UPI0031E29BDB
MTLQSVIDVVETSPVENQVQLEIETPIQEVTKTVISESENITTKIVEPVKESKKWIDEKLPASVEIDTASEPLQLEVKINLTEPSSIPLNERNIREISEVVLPVEISLKEEEKKAPNLTTETTNNNERFGSFPFTEEQGDSDSLVLQSHPILAPSYNPVGHSVNMVDGQNINTLYGFISDEAHFSRAKQVLHVDRITFYFDQWLNAPPTQPPESSFFLQTFI